MRSTSSLHVRPLSILALACFLLSAAASAARPAEEKPLGAKRHERAGISCAGCHAETPPGAKVPTARCLSCHGDYPALAVKSAAVVPNPHAPTPHSTPTSMPACEECHQMHKPSQDSCAGCHDTFDYKTP